MALIFRSGVRIFARLYLAVSLIAFGVGAQRNGKEKVPRTELSDPCSRTVSRNTRKSIEKEVLKPAGKIGADVWPVGCPLDPALDRYGHQERQKQRKRGGSPSSWTCGICGKVFKNEHYLDLHMERMHVNETYNKPVCLADYCEIFGSSCEDGKNFGYRKQKKSECNDTRQEQLRDRCQDGLARCFPLDGAKQPSRKMHAELSRAFCQVLDCKVRSEREIAELEYMPAVVIMILLFMFVFVFFFLVVCCVDYSDDIWQLLVEAKLVSNDAAKKLVQTREKSRQAVGMDRTKCI